MLTLILLLSHLSTHSHRNYDKDRFGSATKEKSDRGKSSCFKRWAAITVKRSVLWSSLKFFFLREHFLFVQTKNIYQLVSSSIASSNTSTLTMQPDKKISPFAKFRQLDRQTSLPKWVLLSTLTLIQLTFNCIINSVHRQRHGHPPRRRPPVAVRRVHPCSHSIDKHRRKWPMPKTHCCFGVRRKHSDIR